MTAAARSCGAEHHRNSALCLGARILVTEVNVALCAKEHVVEIERRRLGIGIINVAARRRELRRRRKAAEKAAAASPGIYGLAFQMIMQLLGPALLPVLQRFIQKSTAGTPSGAGRDSMF